MGESFAGQHDLLSDKVGMYNSMRNGIYRTGLNGMFYEALSYSLIPVASPFAVAGIIDTTNGIYSAIYSDRYKD